MGNRENDRTESATEPTLDTAQGPSPERQQRLETERQDEGDPGERPSADPGVTSDAVHERLERNEIRERETDKARGPHGTEAR